MRYINTLREGETIRNIYLCKGKRSAETRNGKPYDNLILQDKTGTLDGKVWDPNSGGIADYDEKDFIEVYGDIISYNNNLQMNIKQIVARISNPDRERKGNFRHGAEYCPRPAHRTDKPNRFDRKGKPSVESAFPEQSIDQRMQSEKDDERKKFIERGDPAERQTNERRRRKREKPADAKILCKRQHERDLREDITRRKYERHVHADDHKDRSQRARYRRKRDLKRPVFHHKACVLP